ncbi:MAG: ABC transporter permease [Trueperaceae bacterium]|nr:ABC transporter permease [Trueperaceae bacterium]
MRLSFILQVAKKEIVSTLRDRRAIVSSLLIPLLILPFVMLGLPLLLGGLFQREQSNVTEIAVTGLEYLPPELKTELEAQNISFSETSNLEALVRDGEYQVALSIPEGFNDKLESGEKVSLTLISKTGNLRSELNASKIGEAVSKFSQAIVTQRLSAAGLSAEILEPIGVETLDASSDAERSSGQLAWLIPFFIAMWTLTGGQVTALDATAGEKERGTLESLLVSPVRRVEVVVGKFLSTLTFGLSASVMAILGYLLGGALLRSIFLKQLDEGAEEVVQILGGSLQTTPLSIILLLLSALLLASLISALLISITMFARTYKEAQSYVAPLSFVMIIPAIGLQFSDFFGTNIIVYLVPILNALVLMDDIVKGQVAFLPLLATWASLIGFSVLFLDFAFRNFRREGVIFRT